jgi:hypothetical protein
LNGFKRVAETDKDRDSLASLSEYLHDLRVVRQELKKRHANPTAGEAVRQSFLIFSAAIRRAEIIEENLSDLLNSFVDEEPDVGGNTNKWADEQAKRTEESGKNVGSEFREPEKEIEVEEITFDRKGLERLCASKKEQKRLDDILAKPPQQSEVATAGAGEPTVVVQNSQGQLQPIIVQIPAQPKPSKSYNFWFVGDSMLRALPVFSGEVDEFPAWIAAARKYAAIKEFTPATRLNNLKNKLSGKPAQLIRSISALDSNAILSLFTVLEEEYGDEICIIQATKKKLRDLPSPRMKYEDMRNFNLALRDGISCLKSQKVAIEHERQLLYDMVSKLKASWTQSFFERYTKSANLNHLQVWLAYKIPAMRQTELASQKDEKKTEKAKPANPSAKSSKSFATTEVSSGKTRKAFFCDCCEKEGHTTDYCSEFKAMNVGQRVKLCQRKRLHFRCLTRHKSDDCPIPANKQHCPIDAACTYLHHPMLHGKIYQKTENKNRSGAGSSSSTQKSSGESDAKKTTGEAQKLPGTHAFLPAISKGCSLRLFRAYVRPMGFTGKGKKTTIMADQGSSRSLVDEHFIRSFGLALRMYFSDSSTIHGSAQKLSADVPLEISRDGIEWFPVPAAKTMRNLRLPGPELRWKDFVRANPEFAAVETDNVSFGEVCMLLGAELENELLPLEEEGSRIVKDGVLAIKSRLGWTIGGQLDSIIHQNFCYTVLPEVEERRETQNQILAELRRFNDLEALGIEPAKTRLSRGEVEDQLELDRTTFWKDGRITTRMLWKGEFVSVPPSEKTARQRLIWLQQRLNKMGIFEKYAQTIQTDREKGYVRKLSLEESKELRQGIHWFLPHFVIFHPDKPDR